MIKVNLLDPDENKENDSDEIRNDGNINNSSESKKTQDFDKQLDNEYYYGSEENDNVLDNNSNKDDNYLRSKKTHVGWLIFLIVIIISAAVYLLYSRLFNKISDTITNEYIEPIITEQVEGEDVDIAEIDSNKIKESNINEKPDYQYLKNRIINSRTRLKATSKLLKYVPNGLNIKYLSVSKNELSFELTSNKNDAIDRYFGVLQKDKDFYDIKFRSIDNKVRFSKRSSFKVKFRKQINTAEWKLQNIDVNNFIDHIALTADKTNLSFISILEKDVKIVSSPSMKEDRLQMEFYGNLYQIRDFLNKTNKISGSFDVENIEIRNVGKKEYHKLILRIVLFEKV